MKQAMIVAGLGLVLASCASLTPEQCKTANWEQLGYADAMKGSNVMLDSYGKDCGKVSVTPNKGRYMQGYNQGANAFCTYENGEKVGRRGLFYGDICDKPNLLIPFTKGYRKGLAQYELQQMINRQTQETIRQQKEKEELEKKRQEQEQKQRSDEFLSKLGIKTGGK